MSEEIKIIAPSYNRSKGVLTHKILPQTVYAVHEFEAEEYKAKGYEILVIPDSEKGNIARVRNWLKRYYEEIGERFIILDDDIKQFLYWEENGQTRLSGDQLTEHIEGMFDMAEQWGVCMFGVNPASDKGSYREYTPFGTTSYISGSFNGFLNSPYYFDERMPLKEDYDMTIQICNGSRSALRFNQYSMNKDDHGNIGGCAKYRTTSREKEQFDILQKKWGSKIVRRDESSKQDYDINPIIKIPIKGV